MIDIHCHILPNFDDGAKDEEASLAMLQQAANQGVDTIVVTPHYRDDCLEEYQTKFEQLVKQASELNIKLLRGFEYDMSYLMHEKHEILFQILDCNFVLIDFVNDFVTEQHLQLIDNLLTQYKVVIAHPERLFGSDDIAMLRELKEKGCYLQINARSLLSKAHKPTLKFAHRLMRENLIHLVGSDAHDNVHRTINNKTAYDEITKRYGSTVADALFIENNKLLLEDKEVPVVELNLSFWSKCKAIFS